MGARWECPNGKHPAVLAPTKPRKDDIRRYCLPCSEAKGRLVTRVAPRLETARSEALARRKEASKAARSKACEKEALLGVCSECFEDLQIVDGRWVCFGCR